MRWLSKLEIYNKGLGAKYPDIFLDRYYVKKTYLVSWVVFHEWQMGSLKPVFRDLLCPETCLRFRDLIPKGDRRIKRHYNYPLKRGTCQDIDKSSSPHLKNRSMKPFLPACPPFPWTSGVALVLRPITPNDFPSDPLIHTIQLIVPHQQTQKVSKVRQDKRR